MTRSLAPLCLLPPSIDMAWKGVAPPPISHQVQRRGEAPIDLGTQLFWCDPPWHQLAAETSDALARAVATLGVTVSALHRDLAPPESPSQFFDPQHGPFAETDAIASQPPLPRLMPYRPERYGVTLQDFHGRGIIDLRLAVGRDETGAHVFSQQQMERWETTLDDAPVAGGSWVPAATFPPDVISLEHLGSKILQLRKLAPQMAVFVSLGPFRTLPELRRLLSPTDDARRLPDGVIVRLDHASLSALQLAEQTQRIGDFLDANGHPQLPLWIVPGPVSADDAAKLVALGASGVGVDHWCLALVDELSQPVEVGKPGYKASKRGVVIASAADYAQLARWVTESLRPRLERFAGLCRSIQTDPNQRLGSFDRDWADTLKVQWLAAEPGERVS